MLLCMRTTIEINDDLFRQAKKRAADDGGTLRSVVESSLRRYLAENRPAAGYELSWRTERGELQAGVDIDDRDALFDLMEGRD